jgi:hypothetical protein
MRILRGLSSNFLPCGCLAGVYETYDSEVVSILDAKAAACAVEAHQDGKLIPVESSSERQQFPPKTPDRDTARD